MSRDYIAICMSINCQNNIHCALLLLLLSLLTGAGILTASVAEMVLLMATQINTHKISQ